eukprot:scaffold33402_cov42-Phaeocystis_antarctica.AAC.2
MVDWMATFDQLRGPLGPHGVVEPRVNLERLVAAPAQHALQLRHCLSAQPPLQRGDEYQCLARYV